MQFVGKATQFADPIYRGGYPVSMRPDGVHLKHRSLMSRFGFGAEAAGRTLDRKTVACRVGQGGPLDGEGNLL